MTAWRVLFVVTSSDVGGTETLLRELVLRLDQQHFEPIVCSLRPCGRAADDIAAAGIPVLTLDMSTRPHLPELARGLVKLARWIDELHIDLVQSFLYRANTLAGLAARFSRRRPVVVTGQRSLYPLGGRRAAWAVRWTRQLCDRVVAVSEAVRDELISAEDLEPERIVVIENGVDTSHYQPMRGDTQQAPFDRGSAAVVVGGVGRLSPEKGFRHLLEAVALARGHGLALRLVLVGDGAERTELERQADTLGLDGQAQFLGVRRDPRPAYAAFDVFALPSLEEGSPNALLEAMACGCAVVATRVGGVPDIVDDEQSGLLVPPASPEAMAAAFIRLASDPGLRARLGREAARRVRERFDISRTVQRHSDLYLHLLTQESRHAGAGEMMQPGA